MINGRRRCRPVRDEKELSTVECLSTSYQNVFYYYFHEIIRGWGRWERILFLFGILRWTLHFGASLLTSQLSVKGRERRFRRIVDDGKLHEQFQKRQPLSIAPARAAKSFSRSLYQNSALRSKAPHLLTVQYSILLESEHLIRRL